MKLYDIILADPPWNHGSPGWFGGAKNHYPTMSLDDICALPIPAADNCALFMWGCWSLMPEAFEVIKAWGFEYKTEAWVWVKLNSNSMGLFTGMGYYTRGNTEPCLLAIRGSMPPAVHDVPAVIMSPIQQHSRKPAEQYSRIEKLYPNKNYLEMFARRTRPNWDVFGNQVKGSIRLPTPRAVDAATPSEVGAVLHNQISGERGGLA